MIDVPRYFDRFVFILNACTAAVAHVVLLPMTVIVSDALLTQTAASSCTNTWGLMQMTAPFVVVIGITAVVQKYMINTTAHTPRWKKIALWSPWLLFLLEVAVVDVALITSFL